jgi:hypothetical protein
MLTTRRIALSAMTIALVASAGAAVGAQTPAADARWHAWIGCWQNAAIDGGSSLVCVTPTSNPAAVQVATVSKGAIVTRDTIDASGTQLTVNKQGCKGWQSGTFSPDSRRVYLHSDMSCDGAKRTGTAILAISPAGEWLEVQGVTAGGNTGVRVIHYASALPSAAALPAELASSSADRLATSAARAAAGSALAVSDIAEAVKQVDTTVVQAWLIERGAKFKLGAHELLQLADAGVPSSVTDVMIGIAYPDHFALQQRASGPLNAAAFTSSDSARLASRFLSERCANGYNPFMYSVGFVDPCAVLYSSRFGYGLGYGNAYGYGYGSSPYGSYPYGYGYGNGGYYSAGYYAPVVVVKGEPPEHGRVVNGRGYSQGTSSGTSSTPGASTSSAGSSSSGSGGSSSASSGASSSSSSGSSSSGGDRTAHPRPPI